MKTKHRIVTVLALVALAALVSLGTFRGARRAYAQDQTPPPVNDRISFSMVGITAGQTVRINVSNTLRDNDPNLPPGPTRVALNFRGVNGQVLRNRSGEVIRRVVDLERGDSTFLDVDYGELPPGPSRLQLRAVVTVQPPPIGESPPPVGDRVVSTVEVINNANGRTQFAIAAPPAVQRIPPPNPE